MGLEKLKFDKMLVHSYHVSIEISIERSAALLHIRRVPACGLVALAWLSVRVLSSFSPPS